MSNNETTRKMLEEPVGNLIIKNAVPTIVSMLITAIYNMADTYFVSKLGTSASGAVGIIFSLMAIIQACGFTVGQGAGSLTSRALGSGNENRANELCSTGIFLAISLGLIIAVFGTIFSNSIISHLGATKTILPYAIDYGRFILLGSPFMAASFTMNNLLRFQGKAALSMVGLTFGGILNMILDPILIFAFDLGIKGAAIATLFSQMVSFSILLSFFLRKKSTAKLSAKFISRKAKIYAEIFTTGFPSLLRQGMGAISAVLLNRAAGVFGDAAVAGMSINTRVFMFLMSVGLGLGQGFQPVCGMNFGAKKFGRVKEAYFFLIKITFSIMTIFGIIVFFSSNEIVRAFRNDTAVVEIGAKAMRTMCPMIPLHALIFATNMLLQVTGQKQQAALLSSMRQGLYFMPLILLLPRFFGLWGILLSQPLSDFLTALTSIPFAIAFFKKNSA